MACFQARFDYGGSSSMKMKYGRLYRQIFAVIIWIFLSDNALGFVQYSVTKTNLLDSITGLKEKSRDFDNFSGHDEIIKDTLRRKILNLAFAGTSMYSIPSSSEAAIWGNSSPFRRDPLSIRYNPQIPFSSIRQYKTIKLSNGLNVLLVSDARAFRASVALSISGAGQFADSSDLPGMAHLMEHMILSENSKRAFKESLDFEEWLGNRDGASNAFTAYDTVCFHFLCPESVFGEALSRFASLFIQQNVEAICANTEVLKKEIRRVDAELDFEHLPSQIYYLTKDFVNPEHPYSRFSAGSIETLERTPKEADIDVGRALAQFFSSKYLPDKGVLVVISSQEIFALERMVAPFSNTLSKAKAPMKPKLGKYPGGLLQGNRLKHIVLYRKQGANDAERLTMQWALNLDYTDVRDGKSFVTAIQIAFILSQILGRRGPGSLYQFLLSRGWIHPALNSLPRISVPVDVSGFQLIKLEILLSIDGFLNRSSVIRTIYDSLRAVKSENSVAIPRELITQFAAIAKIHGYILAPRPPDAVELSIDSQLFGLYGSNRVGTGDWYRFPSPEDRGGIYALQKAISDTLYRMLNPSNALIIISAGSKSLEKTEQAAFIDRLPIFASSNWQTEPITRGKFFYDDFLRTPVRLEALVLSKVINEEELYKPVTNPLIPTRFRPARVVRFANENGFYRTAKDTGMGDSRPYLGIISAKKDTDLSWIILDAKAGQQSLPLPRSPPEPTGRCAFVLQLLSPRPARGNVRQAARAELWKLSFEAAVKDLAELGAFGGLAYDLSFNRFGLRLTFLGLSQNLPSYARRMCRRLVEHHLRLLEGYEVFPKSITSTAIINANRATPLTQERRRLIISNLRRSTAYEAAAEGVEFLQSCNGAVCFAEGDLLADEVCDLLQDLKTIFKEYVGSERSIITTPNIEDIVYSPVWKPRGASACALPGVPLISDACGRVPR